jgi:Fur family transcriptional regulator, ferric uptake regulator
MQHGCVNEDDMSGYTELAKTLIVQSGSRETNARVRVLAFLLAQESAVSHHQIELNLHGPKIDRVTLYRVLDWMSAKELVHRIVSNDRMWRFRATAGNVVTHQHAHFKCMQCTKVICLDDARLEMYTPRLPIGYQSLENELTIKGFCADCTK